MFYTIDFLSSKRPAADGNTIMNFPCFTNIFSRAFRQFLSRHSPLLLVFRFLWVSRQVFRVSGLRKFSCNLNQAIPFHSVFFNFGLLIGFEGTFMSKNVM
jgi:hypothetical protein